MIEHNNTWCEVLPDTDDIKEQIIQLYLKARKDGFTKLEIYGAMLTLMNLALYEGEVFED